MDMSRPEGHVERPAAFTDKKEGPSCRVAFLLGSEKRGLELQQIIG